MTDPLPSLIEEMGYSLLVLSASFSILGGSRDRLFSLSAFSSQESEDLFWRREH